MSAWAESKHSLRWVTAIACLVAANFLSPGTLLAQGCSDQASTLIKTDSPPDGVAPGGQITYSITLTVSGTGTNGSLTDATPAGTSLNSLTSSSANWVCGGIFGPNACSNTAAPFTGAQNFTMVVTVDPAATGTITNVVTAAFTGATAVTCSDTETTTVAAVPALTATAALLLMVMLVATGVWFTRRRERLRLG